VRVGQAARSSVPAMSSRVNDSLLDSLTTQTSGDHKVLNSNPAEALTL
jgi:hypothetical protein